MIKKLCVRSDVYRRAMKSGVKFTSNYIQYVSDGLNRSVGEITAVRAGSESDTPYVLIERKSKRARYLSDKQCYR